VLLDVSIYKAGLAGSMRTLFWIATLIAIAALLDQWLYAGFYTQAFGRMLSEIKTHTR
jgi:hypothetical protein